MMGPAVSAAFPWKEVMRVGLGRLRLDPAAFWRMTPIEFAAACGTTEHSGQAPGRADLTALMQRYPDGGKR